jgi:hypothetical protein
MKFNTTFQKLLYIGEILFLISFLFLYSCGNSALWVLYFVEKEDIENFYSKDGSGGRSYVNSLLEEADHSNSNTAPSSIHSFIWLLKSYSAVQTILPKDNSEHTGQENCFALFLTQQEQEGFSSLIFHPPTRS